MTLFIDTSALVKLYHKEAGTENIVTLFHKYAGDLVLAIADITIIEFHSALLKRVRTNEIDIEKVSRVFELFENDLKTFDLVIVDDMVKKLATQILDNVAYMKNLRTLDAIQLAAAIITNRNINIDKFVSCDKSLCEIAQYSFSIFNPQETEE